MPAVSPVVAIHSRSLSRLKPSFSSKGLEWSMCRSLGDEEADTTTPLASRSSSEEDE